MRISTSSSWSIFVYYCYYYFVFGENRPYAIWTVFTSETGARPMAKTKITKLLFRRPGNGTNGFAVVHFARRPEKQAQSTGDCLRARCRKRLTARQSYRGERGSRKSHKIIALGPEQKKRRSAGIRPVVTEGPGAGREKGGNKAQYPRITEVPRRILCLPV